MNLPTKLIAAKYSRKRYGIGEPGGCALLFVTPRAGEDFVDEDIAILGAMLQAYNNERPKGAAE